MKNIVTRIVLLYILLFSMAGVIQAQQLTVNDFSFSGNLTANGWIAHSGAGTNPLGTTAGLTYAGLAGSGVGNAVLVNNLGGEDANITYASQNTDGQNIYFSFMARVTDAAASKTGDYFIHLGTPGGAAFTLFAPRVFARIPSAGVVNFGVSNSNVVSYGTTSFATNTTYLIIVKYTISVAGNDPISLWVLPSGVPASEGAAGTPEATNTTTAGQNTISALGLRQGSGTTSVQTVVDGIIVGLTWADVTPGAGGGAALFSSGNINNLTTTTGTASAAVPFNLTGINLSGAAISVAPSANIEVSLTGAGSWVANPSTLAVPYSPPTITPGIPIYVRIIAGAPQGALSETATVSGGGAASSVTVTVTGGVFQNYYNTKTPIPANGLSDVASWSTTTNGLGASPADFTTPYQLFNIISATNLSYVGGVTGWNVSATGNTARVVVGDGAAAINFTVLAGADSLTGATRVDILNNATLTILNNRRPFLNNIATGSTVNFAQTGTSTTDTIRVPTLSYYHLKLTNGIKILSSGTTTIRGNLTIDGVLNFNGAASPFSTINAFGDIFFANGTTFEGSPSGDGNRLTLSMNGNSGSQSILGNGTTLRLFRLRRDTLTSSVDINLGSNTDLILGNNSGGGLQLSQGASTATNLDLGGNNLTFIGGATSTTTSLGKIISSGGILSINKSTVANTAGTLRFQPGSSVDQLVLNFDPTQLRDSITIADDLLVNTSMTFTRGRVIMTAPAVLELATGGTIIQGTDTAFVDGKLKRNTNAATAFAFPVGKGLFYRPVTITPVSSAASSYTAENFQAPYSTLTFTAPLTGVSNSEYWDISKNSGADATVSLSLNGTAVPGALPAEQVGVAHFEAGNWVSVSGTAITPGDATTGTAVSTVLTTFSPFTFGRLAAGVTYTFNGNGNWNDPLQWAGGSIPPSPLLAPDKIIINPSGTCTLNVPQTINPGGQIIVSAGKNFIINGNLTLQ